MAREKTISNPGIVIEGENNPPTELSKYQGKLAREKNFPKKGLFKYYVITLGKGYFKKNGKLSTFGG